MKTTRLRLAIIIAATFLPSMSAADVTLDSSAPCDVEATVRGPAGLSILAKSSSASVDDSSDTLVITIPSASFKTGISLRDDHMRKAIETDRYDSVKLVLQDSTLKYPGIDDSTSGDVMGDLTFHGVTKKISVHYDAAMDCEGHIGVSSKFNINMRDFDVEPPSYFGVSVKPNLSVSTKMRLSVNN